MTKLGRRKLFGAAAAAGLAAAAIPLGIALRPLLRSTDQFLEWTDEPRVRYEPGAEAMAGHAAVALPDAVRTVEARQYRAFLQPPTIHVCASLATYASYGGNPKSGGYVINRRLFISPKPENTPERIPRVITHELSHLHMEQQMGPIAWTRGFPPWFQEGLAVFVSDGAGAEQATEAEAREAIAQDRAFFPETTSGLWHRKSAHSFGLPAHLFYRQAALFVGEMKRRGEAEFEQLLLAIEDGGTLADSFERAYEETIASAWRRFVAEVKAAP